jgi:glyoxylase-like metal-dependent hydrolase (beta-lactamase superfamily II)
MEIVPGIHQIDGINGNCYVIDRNGLTLIDTGLPKNTQRISSYLRDAMHKDPGDITTIILTHYHIDHSGNVAAIKALSKVQVAIHEDDADYLAKRKAMPVPWNVRGILIRLMGLVMRQKPIEPDVLLKDGERVAGLTVIHIPGHTPGSIALLDPASKVLFVGDTLRYDGNKIEGPPPQFTPDMKSAERSIRKIAALDFDILLSGHGVPLMGNAAKKVREFVTMQR